MSIPKTAYPRFPQHTPLQGFYDGSFASTSKGTGLWGFTEQGCMTLCEVLVRVSVLSVQGFKSDDRSYTCSSGYALAVADYVTCKRTAVCRWLSALSFRPRP